MPTAVVHEQRRARPGTALRLNRELTCEDIQSPRSVLSENVSITLTLPTPSPLRTPGFTPSMVRHAHCPGLVVRKEDDPDQQQTDQELLLS